MLALNLFNYMVILKEKAFAKINLSLKVTRKRNDDYHDIDSYVVFVNQYDIVSLKKLQTKNKKIYINIIGPFSKDLNNYKNMNLCKKTALYFLKKLRINDDIEITLEKKLPIASGIGGGSSDAAATLKILTKLYKINLNKFINAYSYDISKKIGADVIACINSKKLLMKGIGEEINKVPSSVKKTINNFKWIVLITPDSHISTKNIFKKYNKRNSPNYNMCNKYLTNIFRNDLKFIAEQTEFKIKVAQKLLSIQKGIIFFSMSGSGPTCFGVFNNKNNAILAKNKIKELKPKWWVKYGSILN